MSQIEVHDIMSQAISRNTPTVSANISLKDASMFSILKKIDILGVISDSKLIGEIRFLEVITFLYSWHTSENTLNKILKIPVTTLMNEKINKISIDSDFNELFQKIKNSKSGTVFVMDSNDSLCGYVSLPDLIPWALKIIPNFKSVNDFSPYQELVFAPHDSTVDDVVELMLKNHVRRVVIKGDPMKIIDDREIKRMLEKHSNSIQTMNDFFKQPVKNFLKNVERINSSCEIKKLGKLATAGIDCFITEKNRIITPWDIVFYAYENKKLKSF